MTATDTLVRGGPLAGFDARALRWLHREHLRMCRWAPQPGGTSRAWHLTRAARCRIEIQRRTR